MTPERILAVAVGSAVLILGFVALYQGIATTLRTRSIRAGGVSILLGSALFGLVAADSWMSESTYFWASNAIRSSTISLSPFAWKELFSPSFHNRFTTKLHVYMGLNLTLWIVVALSSVVLISRRQKSTRSAGRVPTFHPIALMGTLAVLSSGWVWASDVVGNSTWDARFYIPMVMTVALIPTVHRTWNSTKPSSQLP